MIEPNLRFGFVVERRDTGRCECCGPGAYCVAVLGKDVYVRAIHDVISDFFRAG